VTIAEWGAQLVDECAPIAALLDSLHGGSSHVDALASATAALGDPERLPSAEVLKAMVREHEGSYTGFIKSRSEHTKKDLMQRPFTPDMQSRFERLARESVEEQQRIEEADSVPFDEFRQRYLSLKQLVV